VGGDGGTSCDRAASALHIGCSDQRVRELFRSGRPIPTPLGIDSLESLKCLCLSTDAKDADTPSKNSNSCVSRLRRRVAHNAKGRRRSRCCRVLAHRHRTRAVLRARRQPFPEDSPPRLAGDEPSHRMLQGSCPTGQDRPEASIFPSYCSPCRVHCCRCHVCDHLRALRLPSRGEFSLPKERC
jgi:hypothetical protein